MIGREYLEGLEEKTLAPYAQKSASSRGREHAEGECPFRPCFQRDLDRIVHSTAFRRLEYKTQVFINHEGDYYRTRLTHSIEVGQIARGIARVLGLNEDLAQAIALAHDLGHTPFGHAGEAAMNALMEDAGGFEHNEQSYRVVTVLEQRYPGFSGLNLTYEVREGILKHTTDYDRAKNLHGFQKSGFPTLEAQLVNFADEIAYMNHDLDDGLQHGILTFEKLKEVELWQETFEQAQTRCPGAPDKVLRFRTVSRLISRLIDDLRLATLAGIETKKIASPEEVRSKGKKLVDWSPGMRKKTADLKKYLFENMYCHWRVIRMQEKAKRTIRNLFEAYCATPKTLPEEFYDRIAEDNNPKRHICDYIAGMTDRFALQEHKKLFDPEERV